MNKEQRKVIESIKNIKVEDFESMSSKLEFKEEFLSGILLESVCFDRLDILESLKDKNLNLEIVIEKEFLNAFELSVSLGKGLGFLKALNNLGIKPTAKSLILAVEKDNYAAISMILLSGVNPKQVDEWYNKSAYILAKSTNKTDAIELFDSMEEINQKNAKVKKNQMK